MDTRDPHIVLHSEPDKDNIHFFCDLPDLNMHFDLSDNKDMHLFCDLPLSIRAAATVMKVQPLIPPTPQVNPAAMTHFTQI